jgi:hypothetical protein
MPSQSLVHKAEAELHLLLQRRSREPVLVNQHNLAPLALVFGSKIDI